MLTLPKPTAKQQEVLYLPASGHTVVIGSAGCGKTTMALYRAMYLGSSTLPFGGDTAIITYNKSLTNWMSSIVRREPDPPQVMTFHGWARSVLAETDVDLSGYLTDPDHMSSYMARAYSHSRRQQPDSRIFQRPVSFFEEESAWIAGMGITTLDDYRDTQRIGRGETRLGSDARVVVWEVYEQYRSIREKAGFTFDLNDIASQVLALEDAAAHSPFVHVVIDEGQDLRPQMLRAIAHTTPPSGSLAFFGDPTQQIYGKQMSWRSAGFDIRKQWLFDQNYRNTREISTLARAIATKSSDPSLGQFPPTNGPQPKLIEYASRGTEIAESAALARAAVKARRSVAVLSRTGALARAVCTASGVKALQLSRETKTFSSDTIYWGTVHSAKGFEFDEVLVVGLDESSWPDPHAVERTDLDAATDQDRKLLYVAATRARRRLTLSYVGTRTKLLPTDDDLYERHEC